MSRNGHKRDQSDHREKVTLENHTTQGRGMVKKMLLRSQRAGFQAVGFLLFNFRFVYSSTIFIELYNMLGTLLGSAFKGRGRKLVSKLIIRQKPGESKGTSPTSTWGRVSQPGIKEDAKTPREKRAYCF